MHEFRNMAQHNVNTVMVEARGKFRFTNKYKTMCVHLSGMKLTGPVCLYMGTSQGFVSNTSSLSYSCIQAQEQIYNFSGFEISDYDDMRYRNKLI